MNEMLLPEFDQEMATTRKFLERVPDDKFAGKLNEKSMSLGRPTVNLAEIPGLAVPTVKQSEAADFGATSDDHCLQGARTTCYTPLP